MRSLIEKARRVGTGDLEHPLQVHARDELAEVARALNHMCVQLKTSQAEVRTEMEARLHTLNQPTRDSYTHAASLACASRAICSTTAVTSGS
jgi:nitrate/nitrite-specific signal transduction histidine kinase